MTDYLELLLEQEDESGREAADQRADWRAGTPAPAERGRGVQPELRFSAGAAATPAAETGGGQGQPERFVRRSARAVVSPPGSAGEASAAVNQEPAADLSPLSRAAASYGFLPAGGSADSGQAVGGAGRSESTQTLYEQLARSRAAAAFSAQGTAPAENSAPERAEGIPLPAAPTAAELDKVFQRDARRYDGGFSLF